MQTEFFQITKENNLWDELLAEWKTQCQNYNEDFADYATATLPVLQELINYPNKSAGIYATRIEGSFCSVCQINKAGLPKYSSPVLRMRHSIFSPDFDFGDKEIGNYADVIVENFYGIWNLSNQKGYMQAQYINIHLRSPADMAFYRALASSLSKSENFASVQAQGSWLYIRKS